jgi:hypothetical protein
MLLHLLDRFSDLVQTDVHVKLLLLQIGPLFVVKLDKVMNQVEVVARCNRRRVPSAAG